MKQDNRNLWTVLVFCFAALTPLLANADVMTSTAIAKDGQGPRNLIGRGWDTARVFFDADGDGRTDYFVAEQQYKDNQTAKTASNSDFKLYTGTGKGYTLNTKLLNGAGKGCIHPRKAVVNDFNRDGRMDVFVLCHGWDKPPFPGERNKLVLSQPGGTYEVKDAAKNVGFFHGGDSADFNGDGNPDIIVTNNFDQSPLHVWLGDGKCGFKATTKTIPFSLKHRGGYFTATLPDIDGDGRFDLFVGGHEFDNAPSEVYLNDAKSGFHAGKKIKIPAVKGRGVVLDAIATGPVGNRKIWILRTSGGDGTFYEGVCIQSYELASGQSKLEHCDRTSKWFPWLITWTSQGHTYVGSDSSKDAIRLRAD